MRVAVVGSGPAGIYAAEALIKRGGVHIDVFDALPAPFGLVRYGVAPDHTKIKSIEATLRRTLEDPAVRFIGNVMVGTDLTVADLRELYDAVVYAFGATVDRRLGVPGEDLTGSLSATDFVAWYSGHPDARIRELALHAHSVVVVGVGNVAVDVTRILAKSAAELRATDIPPDVLDVLERSTVEDIWVVGRRAAAHAKFTTKELRELGELANADVVVDPADLVLDEAGKARYEHDSAVRRNVDVLREWSQRPVTGRPRRIHVRFLLRPRALLGGEHVTAARFEHAGSGEPVDIPAQMVLRSIGYSAVPLSGVPFDRHTGTIPNEAGRVLRDERPAPGEYTAGWIKRGPTGVIGTNRSDAAETVRSLLQDVDDGLLLPAADPDTDVLDLLEKRGVEPVVWEGWLNIEHAEMRLGAAHGRQRAKIADRDELLAAARSAR